MGNRKECWVTTALDMSQSVNALVLAKSLHRVMTLRSLVVLVSPLIPDEMWKLLQSEFDCCIRLEKEICDGNAAELCAKIHCWSMVKWNKIVFVEPHCLVVKNCDDIFKTTGFAAVAMDNLSVFVVKPSLDKWRKLKSGVGSDFGGNGKYLANNVGRMKTLDEKFNVSVNLEKASMVKNLDEISIVNFDGLHPIEILCRNMKEKVTGYFESTLMDLWQADLEQGVIQNLLKTTQMELNGLHDFIEKYKKSSLNIEYPIIPTEDYKNSIAIVGISCRFPGANNLDEFWQLLIEGRDAMRTVPDGRWTPEKCVKVPEETKNSVGGFLNCSVDEFDGKFFGISPMELSFMDPQQRLTLQVAWEALEDAGINPLSLNGTHTGVFGGAWRNDFNKILDTTGISEDEFLRVYLGNSFGVMTARISHCLGLTGPSIGTDSGCSSSIVAVDLACKSLLRNETDLALACGVNLINRPFSKETMKIVLAADGHCKTFDASADGFGRAEGCGVLVFKRYADAVRDNDRVWALIRGSAVVQEGASKSLGTPTKSCEALAMKLALEEAGVEARDVSFVETHGTGTPVGDPLEVSAIAEVYSEDRDKPLIIGSVKTNIGHTESCSGIAGIIKVVLALKNELIPPHRNFTKLNPNINLEAIPAEIPLQAVDWKKDLKGKPRISGVSSFGITGTDAHAIIQEAPNVPLGNGIIQRKAPGRPCHILKLSAKTEEAFQDNLSNFKMLVEQSEESIVDLAHAGNVGRGDFPIRAAIVGSNKADLLNEMKAIKSVQLSSDEAPKICFLFTGQGSQYPGMAKSLYDHNPIFKINFDICDSYLSKHYGISIKEALWGGNTADISRTIYSQTSIFCIEYCLLKLWVSWGVKPDWVLGHSLGEFAAAVAAEILTFEDALKLVAERSRLIDELPRGKMLVLKENLKNVDNLLGKFFNGRDIELDYAAVNSEEQTVLAGDEKNILGFKEFCKSKGIKTFVLEATHAFHSRHMDPMLEEYRRIASTVKYSGAISTYVSGMEGRIIEDGNNIDADYWVRHTRHPVQFIDASKTILQDGCNLFLEVGPQPVLSAMILMNADGVDKVTCLPSIRKQDENWSTMLTSLGKLYVSGVNIDWKRFDQFTNVKKVAVPFYPFQGKSYWCDIPDQGPICAIHPLVGIPVPNASNVKLYSKQLEVKDAEFLKDHVIGTQIIFPGAGFMEMCIVSGHAATQCTETGYFTPTAPVTLENFTIENPLNINEQEVTQLQAIVSTEDCGGTRVTIYSKLVLDRETYKWVKHASGNFLPFASQTKEHESVLKDTLEDIKSRCLEQKSTTIESYTELANSGLKFGPTFQTLKKMWKGEDEVYFEVEVTDNPEQYICHPVVSDAMFQALMIFLNPGVNTLQVPVSVNKFSWFAKIETETCYIHCQAGSSDAIAVLYDSNGQVLALMDGATLVGTTVATIMASIEAQKMSLPTMYETVWRAQLGPNEKRANLLECFPRNLFENELITEMGKRFNRVSDEDRFFTEKSNKLYAMYMIKSLYNLGWVPEQGKTYGFKELIKSFNVLPALKDFLRYILMELSTEGIFHVENREREEMTFQVVETPPTKQEVDATIEKLFKEVRPMSEGEVELVSALGRQLSELLTGRQSALPILFPKDGGKVSAEAYYIDSKYFGCANRQVQAYNEYLFGNCTKVLKESKNIVRILEVGAGTGSHTKTVLPYLEENPSGYEYTYTDLSPVFLDKGRKIFENSEARVIYQIFNIEEDALAQGFIPNHYDVIIGNNVIHATKSLKDTVGNLRKLLTDSGIILILESIKPARNTNLIFGPLEGYWLFRDYELRPYNCEINFDKWRQVLGNEGFESVSCFPSSENHLGLIAARARPKGASEKTNLNEVTEKNLRKNSKAWVVFSEGGEISKYFRERLIEQGDEVVVVTPSDLKYIKEDDLTYSIRPEEESDMEELFKSVINRSEIKIKGVIFLWGLDYTNSNYEPLVKPFLTLCKLMYAFDHPKLFVFTRGIPSIGDSEVGIPTPSPLWGMVKCFQNEKPEATARCIDFDESSMKNQLEESFSELFINDGEIFVAYRANQRHVARFTPWNVNNSALSFPKSERFRLILPTSNAIKDLRFGPMEKTPLGEEDVEIRIKAYGLNFKDVLTVLKPSAEFEKMSSIGIDYAGVVIAAGANVQRHKVGDAVFGCNLRGDALPSHVVMSDSLALKIPQGMTFNEAATLPAVAATAYLSLIQVAKLTSEDTILIHTASGGVGLVAIQIARSVGATIVATAGSKRKRAYLKSIGIKHIFHSRNTDYEKEIGNALNGRGVDVVLNSLTSAGFKEASLNVCNEGARFVEMSKLNIWTQEEVAELRPDVKYDIVDLSAFTDNQMRDILVHIGRLLEDKILKPIPYVRFDGSDFRDALTYMQKAKHVGKIVCVMPYPEVKSGALEIPMFNDVSTYLITGGLGGIGFEVGKWMIQSGAKNIVLVGRKPPNEKLSEEIQRINSQGGNIIALQCDISNFEQCKMLLDKLKSEEMDLPPLRGIMHAAGVLSDAIYTNQNWKKYETTFNPKVNGGWNLHNLTLDYPLEHFVMFSSAVASIGSLGQSNHASANTFLDSLAFYRNSIGLPATTVNWGQWGQVGVAANIEVVGVKPFTALQGIRALEHIMKSQKLAACVCEIDCNVIKQVFPANKRYLEELQLNHGDQSVELVANNEQFWTDYDTAGDQSQKLNVVNSFVRSMIRRILKLDKDERINEDENFQDLGMDSLMMIEMKNVIQSTLGKRVAITPNSIKNANTINQLTSTLINLISSGVEECKPLTREELVELIREDCELPSKIKPLQGSSYCKPSEIKRILMTGVTGNLGPYILRDTVNRNNVEKIYCLVRQGKNSTCKERLEGILKEKGLFDEIDMDRIECINGSVTQPMLGLSDQEYSKLSEETDAVFHMAVKSDLIDSYRKDDKDESSIRSVNVLGTLNVLEFVCSSLKTKILLHSSSIIANGRLDNETMGLSENWPDADEFDEMPDLGYPTSKFIGDRLMAQAVMRGLPVKAFRFPIIGGDSVTGANVDYKNNQLMLRLMSYIHLGLMPNLTFPIDMLAVDVCSDLALKIFFNDETPCEMYNIYNPRANIEPELVGLGKEMGYEIRLLEIDELLKKVSGMKDNMLIHFLKEWAKDEKKETIRRTVEHMGMLQAWVNNPEKGFISWKLAKYIPEYLNGMESTLEVIRRDLMFAKKSGVFKKMGV